MKKIKIRDYVILYGAFLVYSFSAVFAKMASRQNMLTNVIFFMGLEVILLGIYALIWQQALKRFPLVVAMSSKGITVIMTMIWAVVFFHEHITVRNIVGAGIIILGIWMVSSDD